MSKRLIQRQQVINCGEESCDECSERAVFWCKLWGGYLDYDGAEFKRLDQCKNAEVKKP
jgi:hypothetical protein